MRLCDACGNETRGGVGLGGAFLCRTCVEDVRAEIDSLRSQGRPVNAMGIARRIYRDTHPTSEYLIRDLPDDLRDLAKHYAISEGMTFRAVIIAALQDYLK